MSWQPIESAPEGQWILTYADWDDQMVGISRFHIARKIVEETVSESSNRLGRRKIVQEKEIEERQWEGQHWEPTHWQPLPEPPKG